jgi:hypothetical protein
MTSRLAALLSCVGLASVVSACVGAPGELEPRADDLALASDALACEEDESPSQGKVRVWARVEPSVVQYPEIPRFIVDAVDASMEPITRIDASVLYYDDLSEHEVRLGHSSGDHFEGYLRSLPFGEHELEVKAYNASCEFSENEFDIPFFIHPLNTPFGGVPKVTTLRVKRIGNTNDFRVTAEYTDAEPGILTADFFMDGVPVREVPAGARNTNNRAERLFRAASGPFKVQVRITDADYSQVVKESFVDN